MDRNQIALDVFKTLVVSGARSDDGQPCLMEEEAAAKEAFLYADAFIKESKRGSEIRMDAVGA